MNEDPASPSAAWLLWLRAANVFNLEVVFLYMVFLRRPFQASTNWGRLSHHLARHKLGNPKSCSPLVAQFDPYPFGNSVQEGRRLRMAPMEGHRPKCLEDAGWLAGWLVGLGSVADRQRSFTPPANGLLVRPITLRLQ